MHDYNTILGVIELRLSKVSYDSVQKRYRIGRSGIALIMNRYKDSGLSLDDLRQMPASKVVDLIYPKENLRHSDKFNEACVGCDLYDFCEQTRCKIVNKLLTGEFCTPSPIVCAENHLLLELN